VECGGLPAEKAGSPPLFAPPDVQQARDPARLTSPGESDGVPPNFSLLNLDSPFSPHPERPSRQARTANSGAEAPHSTDLSRAVLPIGCQPLLRTVRICAP